MAERHKELHFDEQRRLHRADGPAILCRDDYRVYAWHGTRIPRDWIEKKDEVDPSLALTWENIEQRRALAEILGWGKVIAQLSPKVIDEDPDPEIGTLLQVDLPDAPGSKFIRVLCGTKREFVLAVPPETTSALQGNAWTFNVDTETLKQLEKRT